MVSTLVLDNRQVLTALKEVEAARTKALSGDNSDALERALQGLATAAKEANARLDPLAKQAQLTLREMQNLANAVKAGAAEIQSSLQRYRELEAILKGQVAVLDKAGAGYLGIAKDMKAAGDEGKKLESLNKSLTASYKTEDLTRYGRGLLDIVQAQKAGVTSQTQAISQLKSYQSALAQQTGALEKNSAEYKSVIKAMGDTGTAIKKLEADADKLTASFRSDELSRYAGEFKQIDAAVKSGTDGFENASTRVQKLSAELKEQQGALTNTGREFDQFSRLLKEAAAQQERYQVAAEQAARANDASQLRTYGTELKQLEATLRDTTAELGRLDSQQRAIQYDSGAVSQFRGEQERLSGSFEQVGRGLGELKTKLQDYGDGLIKGTREHDDFARAMLQVEGAATRLETATTRAGKAFTGEDIRRYVTELKALELAYEQGDISQEQFTASARDINVALTGARDGVDRNTRAYEQYTDALRRVETSSFKAGAGVRTFGTFAGVTAGVSDQLQNVLYRLGPAGEAVGVAMYSASAGMAGASLSAKALNIALTVGVVGAIIGAAVAAKALVDRAFELDTGMTNVAKTTGFTGDQLLQLESRLQDIAVATGTGVTELLDYAAVAGQLGIKGVDNIAQFVDVMNQLAIATNIVGEEGAEQMAQFVNITKEAGDSVGESAATVGNVITALGNSLATTEKPILNMAQRLVGLSTVADVSQVDILGLAGALTALGINAEAGGTATTQIFSKIVTAVEAGGAELDKFAQVAGLTSDEFARLVKENPTDAFYALVGGMKASKDEGGSLLGIYDSLGFSGERQRLVLSSLVNGYDTFGLSLKLAREEAESMTALQNELNTRLGGLKGITDLVAEAFKRVGNELAIAMIPALKDVLTETLDFIRALTGLEQTGDRTKTFFTQAGTAINQFAIGMFDAGNAADTFAGQLGGMFSVLGDGLTDISATTSAAGISVNTFLRSIFGIEEASGGGGRALTNFSGAADEAGNSAAFLASQVPEINDSLNKLSGVLNGSKSGMVAYRDELTALIQKYPEAEYAIRPAIDILNKSSAKQDANGVPLKLRS